jgi:hypothetical protein
MVTVTVTGLPGVTVPPVLLSVMAEDDEAAVQFTAAPVAVSVTWPVYCGPSASSPGETLS